MEDKKGRTLIISILLLFISFGFLFIFYNVLGKNKPKEVLSIDHSTYYSNLFTFSCLDEYCIPDVIRVKNKNVKQLGHYKDLYYGYFDDNNFKIYDSKNKASYIVNTFDNNISYVDFVVDETSNDLVGIIYFRNNDKDNNGVIHYSYLSINNNKVMYNYKYTELKPLSSDYLEGKTSYCLGVNNCFYDDIVLLNTNEEKEIRKVKYDYDSNSNEFEFGYKILSNDKVKFIIEKEGDTTRVLNYNGEFKTESGESYVEGLDDAGNLYLKLYNKVTLKIDSNGRLVDSLIDSFDEVKYAFDNYSVVLINNKLYLVTLTGDQYFLDDFKEGMYIYDDVASTYKDAFYSNRKGLFIKVAYPYADKNEIFNNCFNHGLIKTIDELDKFVLGYQYYFNFDTKEIIKEGIVIN